MLYQSHLKHSQTLDSLVILQYNFLDILLNSTFWWLVYWSKNSYLMWCLYWVRPLDEVGARGPWLPIFSKIVICLRCFLGNSLLRHSRRHQKLFWPQHSQNPVLVPVSNCVLMYILVWLYLFLSILVDVYLDQHWSPVDWTILNQNNLVTGF